MTVEEALAVNLKQLLQEKHMTHRKLCKDADVATSTLACILYKGGGTTIYTAYKFAKVLGVSVNDLIEGADE